MAKKAIYEILGTRFWDFEPGVFQNYRKILENSFSMHTQWEKDSSMTGVPYLSHAADGFVEKVYAGNAERISWWEDLEDDDQVINIIPVEGPILRNGDACSYGSQEYRDHMLRASEIPQCVGHIFYINTPGGSAYSKNDFKYAIDRVRAKGQPVIALIDGLCASAGMALASMCDRIYFLNPMDRIGCIGTMGAFYATPNGAIDTRTQERYVEVYGKESPYKNKEFRDAAEGDNTELQAEVDNLNLEFQTLVRTYRPSVKEEQLKGRIYNAGDVVGTLTDGQSTMEECINTVLQMAGVPKRTATAPPASAGTNGNTDDDNEDKSNKNNNPKNQLTMKEYPKIMSALGLNELGVGKDESIYLHVDLAEGLESTLAQAEQDKTSLDAKVDEVTKLNARIEEMKHAHETALSALKQSHQDAVEELTKTHEATVQTLKDEHAAALASAQSAHEEALNAANAATETANQQLAEAQSQLAAKEAELQEISGATTPPQKPETPPADNSVGATVKESKFATKPVFKDGMSLTEASKAYRERMGLLDNRFNQE